jgi:bifunctional non-homologous end joining protein LigD
VCDEDGMPRFDRIRYRRHDASVFLYAFDLIISGDDLRRDPLQVRKATLVSILAKARPGIRFNEHIEGDGPTVFAHACKLGPRRHLVLGQTVVSIGAYLVQGGTKVPAARYI